MWNPQAWDSDFFPAEVLCLYATIHDAPLCTLIVQPRAVGVNVAASALVHTSPLEGLKTYPPSGGGKGSGGVGGAGGASAISAPMPDGGVGGSGTSGIESKVSVASRGTDSSWRGRFAGAGFVDDEDLEAARHASWTSGASSSSTSSTHGRSASVIEVSNVCFALLLKAFVHDRVDCFLAKITQHASDEESHEVLLRAWHWLLLAQ